MHAFAEGRKIWMISLITIFAVHPICIQDSIFKMSSASPEERILNQITHSFELLKKSPRTVTKTENRPYYYTPNINATTWLVEGRSHKHTINWNRDHFACALSQWETTLQGNIASHWLGARTTLSLWYTSQQLFCSRHISAKIITWNVSCKPSFISYGRFLIKFRFAWINFHFVSWRFSATCHCLCLSPKTYMNTSWCKYCWIDKLN